MRSNGVPEEFVTGDAPERHKKIAEDSSISAIAAPSFRPDKALNIHKAGWREYIEELGQAAGVDIHSLDSLKLALSRRIDHFHAHCLGGLAKDISYRNVARYYWIRG